MKPVKIQYFEKHFFSNKIKSAEPIWHEGILLNITYKNGDSITVDAIIAIENETPVIRCGKWDEYKEIRM